MTHDHVIGMDVVADQPNNSKLTRTVAKATDSDTT